MPVSYTYKKNIIVLEVSGQNSPEDIKESITQALEDDNCPAETVLMIDMRTDESVQERKQSEIRDMSFFMGSIKDKIHRRLCMVTGNELAYGLMNMAKVYDESMGINCQVFTDPEKAEQWLSQSVEVENK